jgi:hypothetical protein
MMLGAADQHVLLTVSTYLAHRRIPRKVSCTVTDTPLKAVKGWTADQIARLNASWITTAEQVVALAATNDGLKSLSEQLHVSKAEAARLVDLARSSLSADVRAEMEQKVDTSNYGLGVIQPRNKEEKED